MTEKLRAGDVVRAFHPRMVGVVKTGTVVNVGSKWVRIDFGELLGGIQRVAHRDVLGKEAT